MSPILFAVYVDSLLGRLEQSGVGCHIGGHFVGALAYADDVTLVAPSRSGIRTLINVCEQFALDYDITFNGTKSQLMFFKGRFSNVSAYGFHVNGQYVEVSKCAMHLGHSISSGDRTEIVKYAKISLIYLELILVIFPLNLKMYYFKNIVVFSMDHPCGL